MRAFLSHSSKDKDFVRQVAIALGEAQCEYDENSFEYTLNVQAIHQALQRSEVFVYFLSAHSITSAFVSEEQRAALEKRGSGLTGRVLIFSLDNTSYQQLPLWLREINVVRRLSSPGICARKIQAALVSLEAERDADSDIYLGRDLEDAAISKVLSGAPTKTPIALHAVGHYGVGRKTFIRQNLRKLFPRRFETFPEITISLHQGIEELYRQLHDLVKFESLENTLRDVGEFSSSTIDIQIHKVVDILHSLIVLGEFLIITDDGGVYTEEGDYQPHIKEILNKLDGRGLPVLSFVQTRMMPARFKEQNQRSYHQYLSTLNDEHARQLFGLTLKQLDLDYTHKQLDEAVGHFDGHPFNIKFAAVFSHDYGLELLLADPSELLAWKRKRAEDFLQSVVFSVIEIDILAALEEYRYLATEMIFVVLDSPISETALALRRLQEFSCVERREGYCHIAPPLREAIRRDKRFTKSDSWKQDLGRKICDAISEYHDDENISLSILDGAALAAARGHDAPRYLSTLILPSHLLRIARDYYDSDKRALCIEFCERAWKIKERLPFEAQLEVLRIWGLSTVRINNENGYRNVLALFQGYHGKAAERIRLFVEGFYCRVNKMLDKAEEKFYAAWNLSPKNQHINRELANLLAKQRRYGEAERFARQAYEEAPTNPFLIDVMVEVLIGKQQQACQLI